jgi:transcriptional regulator with XRE-family HTH domain
MMKPMTIAQFAEKIGVTKRTLMRWHEDGKLIPAYVLPSGERRYAEEQVDLLRGKLPHGVREMVEKMCIAYGQAYDAWQAMPRQLEPQGYANWREEHDRLYDFREAHGPEVAKLIEELGVNLQAEVRFYDEDPETGMERKKRKGVRRG